MPNIIKHGGTKTKLYSVWKGMRRRCNNPKSHAYKYYGGRGITVCKEWDESFVAFKSWASRSGYAEGLTIDRINNNEGYSPENCRWATRSEQMQNTRLNSRAILVNGKPLSEISKETGIKYKTLKQRYYHGWEPDRITSGAVQAIKKPVRAYFSDGSFKDFESMQKAKEDGFLPSCISECINGIQKNHRGAKWELL